MDVLAIDLGKTGCRAALWTDDGRTDAAGGGAPGLAAVDGLGRAETAIVAVGRPLLQAAGLIGVRAIGIGAAGALAAPEAARALAGRLCALFSAATVAVASDAATSHAGALGGRPGVVLAAGTGAVAIAVGADGAMARADGWGPWLGDSGGGAWLGRQGLRAVLRAHDGRGPATALSQAAAARFGPADALPGLMEGTDEPARLLATFAADVARAAEAGDGVAAALLDRAGRALGSTAAAAAGRLGARTGLPFAAVGGLLALGPLLTRPMLACLQADAPWLRPVAAEGAALDGARLLALRQDTVHEPGVARAARA